MNSEIIENKYDFELFDNTRYIIGEKLGDGSYGSVYKVIDLSSKTDDLYAIKILKSAYSKKYIENLIKYSANNHDNIESLYRSYRGKRPSLHQYRIVYLDNIVLPDGSVVTGYATISELANYGNLCQYLKSHKDLNFVERLEIVSMIVNGIQNLHCKSICHSALKAENVLVFKKNIIEEHSSRNRRNDTKLDIEISLSDFSVIPSFGERNVLSPNQFYASYTSPNCIKFPCNGYTFEDDIYSLGLLLWQIVYNEMPFEKEFKEINVIKLYNAFTENSYNQNSFNNKDNIDSSILPIRRNTSKDIPYLYKKKIDERNKEMQLLESYNQIQQSTHYINDNFRLNLNQSGRFEHHSENRELLKLYNLIVEENLRPEVSVTLPILYHDLIMDCWQREPIKRPDLAKVEETVDHLKNSGYKNKTISLSYQLSDRQSKSLSRCLVNNNVSNHDYKDSRKEKTKSVWDKFINPRESIMRIFKPVGSNYSDLRKGKTLFDSPISEETSLKNPLLQDTYSQHEIEMDDIQIPEQCGYNNIPIGHCENDYTTINIDDENDTVIIDTNNLSTKLNNSSDNINQKSDSNNNINTSYMSDTTHANNISYISNGIDDSINENNISIITSVNTNMNSYNDNYNIGGFYGGNEPQNTLIYHDLILEEDEEDQNNIDSDVLEELEKYDVFKKKNDIDDPLNSKLVNIESNKINNNNILHGLNFEDGGYPLELHHDFSSNFSNTNTSFTVSDEEDIDTITNYNVTKNYINYTNNKRNTLFAFLESKTENNNSNKDVIDDDDSSDENLNFYDEEDVKELQEKTISANSIKDYLKNAEKGKLPDPTTSFSNTNDETIDVMH
ncbi:kinase-like protein [Anaeromyces robustus]|uniref:Kinase-like protein n=1 Tax=Anaeromyces robustus TaxID=1754192 RepID=A0A1Y1XCR2_9FUNG|nr:kinase-like protein [Anaeromyces robustus]|eukprot:ORX83581.1 kinase-like protein [Anaeromyces robustus]